MVWVNGAKRVLVWSSKQAPLHASGEKHSSLSVCTVGDGRQSNNSMGHATHHRLYVAEMILITLLGVALALNHKICT